VPCSPVGLSSCISEALLNISEVYIASVFRVGGCTKEETDLIGSTGPLNGSLLVTVLRALGQPPVCPSVLHYNAGIRSVSISVQVWCPRSVEKVDRCSCAICEGPCRRETGLTCRRLSYRRHRPWRSIRVFPASFGRRIHVNK
jgi:hypothetical protein